MTKLALRGQAYVRGIKSGGNICRKNFHSPLFKGFGEISALYWHRLVNGARRRKIKMTVDIKYAWKLFLQQSRRCKFTDQLLHFRMGSHDDTTASLDRIDSRKGYVRGNLQWVHKDINNMKQQFTNEHFIYYCRQVAVHADRSDIQD